MEAPERPRPSLSSLEGGLAVVHVIIPDDQSERTLAGEITRVETVRGVDFLLIRLRGKR